MSILKSQSKCINSLNKPNSSRRSFIWKTGAAVTAVLASAIPGIGKTLTPADQNSKTGNDQISKKLGILEDEKSIRELHRTYESLLNEGMYDRIPGLFSEKSEVVYNGGVFKNRIAGVTRFYIKHFKPGLTGKHMEPAPGFLRDAHALQEKITVAPDRMSANAQFPYSIRVGAPIISDSQLVKMAQLQGQGILNWWEGGTCEVSYVKEGKESAWKIKSLNYHLQARTNHRPGKSHSEHISIPSFKRVYPYDKAGPDKLV